MSHSIPCRPVKAQAIKERYCIVRADRASIVDDSAIEVNVTPIHCRPDSERLLRTHNAWQASWDQSDKEQEPDIDTLAQQAFAYYSSGYLPIQVNWLLRAKHSGVRPALISRAQRKAEAALCAAESAPPELRRAMVAATRQKAIQGALMAGQYGAAAKMLERAGEVAGELRESAGLAEEDLVLTVTVEQPALPAGDSRPVASETGADLTAETVETEAEA